MKELVQRYGSQEAVSELLMKSKQWVSNVLAAADTREALAPILEQQGVKDSLSSSHLRDIAALPEKDQLKAAREALDNGGGKRAFRAAAQKAKEKRGQSVKGAKCEHLFTLNLTVDRKRDAPITLKSEITGEASTEVRARFEAFSDELKTFLLAEGSVAK